MMEDTNSKPKLPAAFFKPHWEMLPAEKVAFIGHYGSEVWGNKIKSETPDYKDREAFQEYQKKIEEARRRDDPSGFRR